MASEYNRLEQIFVAEMRCTFLDFPNVGRQALCDLMNVDLRHTRISPRDWAMCLMSVPCLIVKCYYIQKCVLISIEIVYKASVIILSIWNYFYLISFFLLYIIILILLKSKNLVTVDFDPVKCVSRNKSVFEMLDIVAVSLECLIFFLFLK